MRGFIARYKVECAILLLVAVACFGRAWMAWPADPIGSEAMRWSRDADSWLRLTLVRDWMEGGSWYDHGMKRSNAPEGGIQSPWTRPLDVVIAGLASLVGQGDPDRDLIKAALLLPGIWSLLYIMGVFYAARRLLPHPDHPLIAVAVVACLPMMWNYFGVANADHHAPLAVLFAWVLGLLVGQPLTVRAGAAAGALLGLMLWISPEALLIMALVLLFLGGRWLAGMGGLRPLWALSLAMTCMTLLAVCIEQRPQEWFVPLYDEISVVHVVGLSLVSAVLTVLYYVPVRWLALLLAALAALMMWVIYPDFYRGPLAGAHPYIEKGFLPFINEARPLWKQPHILNSIAMLWQPFLAAVALLLLAVHAPPRSLAAPTLWLLAVFLSWLFLLVMVQVRWYYYLAPVVALSLSAVLAPLMRPEDATVAHSWPARTMAGETQSLQIFVRQLAMLCVIGVPLLLAFLSPDEGGARARKSQSAAHCETLAAMWIRTGGMQATLGAGADIVLAPTNLGAQILYYTPYRIIASNYHREGAGIEYAWESFAVTDMAELRAYLARRNVDTLLLCSDTMAPGDSALMRIYRAEAPLPGWMERIELQATPEWRGLPKKNNEPMLLRIKK